MPMHITTSSMILYSYLQFPRKDRLTMLVLLHTYVSHDLGRTYVYFFCGGGGEKSLGSNLELDFYIGSALQPSFTNS